MGVSHQPASDGEAGGSGRPALATLYRQMLRIRIVEQRLAELYAEQEMRCPVHLCVGQEAVAVGVAAALGAEDYALSGHRAHGHYLAKGGDLRAMMAELYGRATGCCGGKGGSMHLVDVTAGFLGAVPIVGSTIPIAAGVAFGCRLQRRTGVTVAFFGDGAVEEGVFHETLSFAALKRLPVLFVCENNFFSVYSPLEVRQPPRPIRGLAAGHGLPAFAGDGNDVETVYALAEEAVARARAGAGPTFLELETYRWYEHCGPLEDDHLGYRSLADIARWKTRCPIARCEERLVAAGARPEELAEMARAIREEVDQAVAFAKASPFPEPAQLHTHVYPGATG